MGLKRGKRFRPDLFLAYIIIAHKQESVLRPASARAKHSARIA
jgi:hypothetical protein